MSDRMEITASDEINSVDSTDPNTSIMKYGISAVVHGSNYVTNLDFHESGNTLIMGTSNSVHLIDCKTGEEKKKVFVRTHGVGKMKYTHHELCLILSSEKKTNDLRYLSLYDNKYLRYFRGHNAKVTSIAMSPDRDQFMSASLDRTICLWELNTSYPLAKLKLDDSYGNPYVAYDHSAQVVGIMCDKQVPNSLPQREIRLFDSRQMDKGPFGNIAPTNELINAALTKAGVTDVNSQNDLLRAEWNHFEFSPDGKHILVNTSQNMVLVLNSFYCETPVAICSRGAVQGYQPPVCFSTDSKYVFSGSIDNNIQVFDKITGGQVSCLSGLASPVNILACNPVYDMMASACVATALWLPLI